MLSQSPLFPGLVVLALTLPLTALCDTAISVNNACQVSDCSAAGLANGALTIGTSASGNYSFSVTLADGDIYSIAGNYNNTFPGGTFVGFFPLVTYTGNKTQGNVAAVATDVLALDLLQDFTSPGNNVVWDGTYNESIPIHLSAAGSSATGNVTYDGQSVGVLGPVSGPGNFTLTNSKALAGLDGNTLVSDYNITFTFNGGTSVGTSASSPAPEPVQTIPVALGLIALLAAKTRKSRTGARS